MAGVDVKYSEILGPAFYQIGLSEADAQIVDVHFTASPHHFWILRARLTPEQRRFHVTRHCAHLHVLMMIVF